MPSRSTSGISSSPDQKKRCKRQVGGREADVDAVLGRDKAGRPAERRAGAAQHADQDRVPCRRRLSLYVHGNAPAQVT